MNQPGNLIQRQAKPFRQCLRRMKDRQAACLEFAVVTIATEIQIATSLRPEPGEAIG